MGKRSAWGKLRLVVLLVLLVVVALNSWLSRVRTTDWQEPLWIMIYPVNADKRNETQLYIDALQEEHFEEIEQFLAREGQRYGLQIKQPVEVYLAPPVEQQPPKPDPQANILQSVIWSLNLRYWSWRNDSWQGPPPHIRIYLRLFSPQNRRVLEHSLGLQKGMVGVVNGFASIDYQPQNNFVAAHEILHTLGASDKYDLTNNQPIWPQGYADPYQQPLLPQFRAEIMGGRVAQTRHFSLIPDSLEQVVIGPETATELNWIQAGK